MTDTGRQAPWTEQNRRWPPVHVHRHRFCEQCGKMHSVSAVDAAEGLPDVCRLLDSRCNFVRVCSHRPQNHPMSNWLSQTEAHGPRRRHIKHGRMKHPRSCWNAVQRPVSHLWPLEVRTNPRRTSRCGVSASRRRTSRTATRSGARLGRRPAPCLATAPPHRLRPRCLG